MAKRACYLTLYGASTESVLEEQTHKETDYLGYIEFRPLLKAYMLKL